MALTRSLLRELNLEDSVIEQIIQAHSETVTALKAEIDAARTDASALAEVTAERDMLLEQIALLSAQQADAQQLQAEGIAVDLIDMHTVKPLDTALLRESISRTGRCVTVEDHNVIGGLGSAVAEVMAEAGKGCAFTRLGLQDKFAPIGLHEDIMSMVGIDCNGIVAAVREAMNKDFEEDDNWDDDV